MNVHSGVRPAEVKNAVYAIAFYFVRLFEFHIQMGRNFKSFAEANEFLDLSPDPSLLIRKVSLGKLGLKYRGNGGS